MIRGIVGANRHGVDDGSVVVARRGKTGEMAVGYAHCEHYEATSRGNVFTAATGTAGASSDGSINTSASFILYNPIGSDVNLSVLQASAWLGTVGTPGAGTLFYTTNAGIAMSNPANGTVLTSRSALLCGGGPASKGIAKQGSGTLLTSEVVLRPFAMILAYGGEAEGAAFPIKDQLNGEFVIQPGFFLGIDGLLTGTNLYGFAMTWEEVPIT